MTPAAHADRRECTRQKSPGQPEGRPGDFSFRQVC
jgi:hypothetical protein